MPLLVRIEVRLPAKPTDCPLTVQATAALQAVHVTLLCSRSSPYAAFPRLAAAMSTGCIP